MSVRPLHADELLQLAGVLAGIGAGRGRPPTVQLRRSVSTSYYAVFHELSAHCVEAVFDDVSGDERRRWRAARWIRHEHVRVLAQSVLNNRGKPALIDALSPAAPDLLVVAQGFLDLIDARHDSDYNHEYDIDKRTALSHLALAQDVVTKARRLKNAGDRSYLRFSRLMLGAAQIATKR